MEIKKVTEEWEIWNKEKEAARSEKKAKKLVLEQFHKWIKVWEEGKQGDADKKDIESHNRVERRVCA